MLVTRFYLCLTTLLLWTLQKTRGAKRHCGDRRPVVDICTNSEVIMKPNVFIDTENVPTQQNIRCVCTISPSKAKPLVLLTYRKTPAHPFYMQFRINDVVLNKAIFRDNTTLLDETDLVLTTDEPHSNGVCVLFDTGDASTFNITCEGIATSMTRTVTTFSTTAAVVTSDVSPKAGASDIDNEVQTSRIGPIVGGAVGGVVCLVIVIMVIILCRRKYVSKKRKCTEATTHSNDEKNTEPLNNEDDYYMTENPMYNMPDNAHVQESENDYNLIQQDDNGGRPSSEQYEYLPDSPIDEHLPLSHDQDHNTH